MTKPTERMVELLQSEAARYRAMAKYQERLADDCIEVAEALDIAAGLMSKAVEVPNACR